VNSSDKSTTGPDDPVVYLLNKGSFTEPAQGQIIGVKPFTNFKDLTRSALPLFPVLQGIAAAGTLAERQRIRQIFSPSSAVYFPQPGRLQSPSLDWNL
jgi:hypothetical protein